MDFKQLYNHSISLEMGLNQLQQEGNLVYEYNPLKVLRINKDTVINGNTYPKGSLIGLDTDLFNFDLENPINITPQQSYDGSTNLILNDGKNPPRLINTRFTSTGMNTYKIVDREGDNDTNIYDVDTFESDISLYKRVNSIVKLSFLGINTGGNLKVGNYVFYFKLSDSDGNETDFIAESSIVTCHIGNINDPKSIQGGIRDENSYKSVSFLMSKIDSSYNNVNVYYTRSTSDIDGNEITTSFKISKSYPIYNNVAKITISGYENTEAISINDINVAYNVIDNCKAQTASQNMLFLGNVHNPEIEYKELSDLSLYFLPEINDTNNIGFVDENYNDPSGQYEYYNVQNIYNKLGYWNGEIYRLGIVYILKDYTLSPVFNIRGSNNVTTSPTYTEYHPFKAIGWDSEGIPNSWWEPSESDSIDTIKSHRDYIPINKETYKLDSQYENSKGVIKLNYKRNQLKSDGIIPLGLNIKVDKQIVQELKRYTNGFFFVRQKRIPTILGQAVTIGLEQTSHLPVLPIDEKNYIIERFLDDNRELTHNYVRRIAKVDNSRVLSGYAALCPEFELRQSYFNHLFTGTEFTLESTYSQFSTKYMSNKDNYYYNLDYTDNNNIESNIYNITAVGDNIKIIKGKDQLFSARAGEAEEAWRFSYYGYSGKYKEANNLVRGSCGPYIGIEGYNTQPMSLLNIRIPNYEESRIEEYFTIRFEDASAFYAISDRYSWEDINDGVYNIFRGDCFIGNYTHRMIRNFQDPSAPINDEIVDQDTWKDYYSPNNEENNAKINRGDVNAIQLGHWVTIKVCSNVNLSMRCLDLSYVSEYGLTGKRRGFYPIQAMSVTGESKIPESFIINGGINSTTSDKYNFESPDVPAIKNNFNTRILYSDISINDSFKNGFRVFKLTNYRDYPLTYGNITKLIEWFGNIICVFEHGVALIPVNERAVAGSGAGGNVFINTSNVLPENPRILSSTFGSQWADSIIDTPYYVYGVDTVGKRIWRTNGEKFETISDFRIQKFLNSSISLSESELTPIIGIRNVKSHYNAFKQDVIFTFYDDLNVLEETAWSLCYNEIMQKFITFYSWIPSYSANIDNSLFTFDRSTSKIIAKLSNKYNNIYLKDGNILNELPSAVEGKIKLGQLVTNIPYSNIEFSISDGIVKNKYFIKQEDSSWYLYVTELSKNENIWSIPVKAVIYNNKSTEVEGNIITVEKILYTTIVVTTEDYYNSLTTSFWKHGQAGLIKTSKISPCKWYGEQHPFEFEVIAVDNPSLHKIFTNLQIISNSAKPESIHFEISGDVYTFAKDKKNMFFRQEATKHLYQYNGADIKYNSNYLNVIPEQRNILYSATPYKDTSTMFPLYYSRVQSLNTIYDYYQSYTSPNKDYQFVSGSEITYDNQTNTFGLATHIKACPFDERYPQEIDIDRYNYLLELGYTNIYTKNNKYYEIMEYGRINGNMNYQEDKWDIQIPSITYWEKNEKEWMVKHNNISYPPLNIVNNPLPESMNTLNIDSEEDIPEELRDLGYMVDYFSLDINKWGPDRKETRIRDKYLKIKIRYTGDDLAIITALKTLYTISFA